MRVKNHIFSFITFVLFLCLWTSPATAVTFSSSEQTTQDEPVQLKQPRTEAITGSTVLDLPKDEAKRIGEAYELTRLTGIQAKLALQELTDLDGQVVAGPELEARLQYAYDSLEALEKASKRLEDSVKLAEVAYGKKIYMKGSPIFFLGATPAWAWGMKDALKSLSNAAKTVGKYATKVKNAVKSGISKVTGAIGTVHSKIGSVVGQKNWATIMATTKCVATVSGIFVGIAIAAPASVAGAAFASVVFLAGTAGAATSLANDLSEISGQKKPFGPTVGNVNKGLSFIGVFTSGSWGEVFVNVVGVTGDDIVETTPGRPMTVEEMRDYIDRHGPILDDRGLKTDYTEPEDSGDDSDDGDEGDSSSCSDGCGS